MSWETAVDKSGITRALLLEMLLGSTTVRAHDGVGSLSWNTYEWTGVGDLGGVGGISGSIELEASELTVILSGVPTDYRDEVAQEVTRGRRCNLYQGIFDPATGDWSFEPELIFAGFCDAPLIEEEAPEGVDAFLSITVPIISAASYARRLRVWRRTDSDQRELYPADAFFSFKTDMRVPVANTARAPSNSLLGHVYPRSGGSTFNVGKK